MPSARKGVPSASPIRSPSGVSTPPAPPLHLPRPALVGRLHEAFQQPLTLVVAPAGHGKTTGVAEACRASTRPVVWVHLGRSDRQPARVRRRLAAATRQLEVTAGAPLLVVDDAAGALDGAAAEVVDDSLRLMPPAASAVVLARRRPGWISDRHATSEVAFVGAEALALTRKEAEALLNGRWQLALDAPSLDALARATEGWPTALALVGNHLHARGATAMSEVVVRAAGDYVVEEALADLHPGEREAMGLLLDMDRIDALRCATATGRRDGEAIVAALEAHGVLIPESDRVGEYHLHRLVRAVLRHHRDAVTPAVASRTPDAEPAPGQNSRWLDDPWGAMSEGGADGVADWVGVQLASPVAQGGGHRILDVARQLPPEVVVARPAMLATVLDSHLLAGDREELERLLDAIESRGAGNESLAGRTRADLGRLRGDVLSTSSSLATDPDPSPLRELANLADLAWERATLGRLGEADLLLRRATRQATRMGLALPARAQLAMAQIALDRGHPDVALQMAVGVRERLTTTDDLASWVEAGLLIGRSRGASHGPAAAAVVLDQVHARLALVPPGAALARRVARAEAGLRLAMGDAESLSELLPELFGHDTLDELVAEDRLLLARMHLRRGDPSAAFAVAATLASGDAGPRAEAEGARLVAVAARACGDVLASRRARARAAEIARIEGLSSPISRRPPRAPGTPVGGPSIALGGGESSARPLFATTVALTEREQHVLRLLPTRMSAAEIAGQLYVSVNTVKSHTKSIYRKLGVGTRRDAITRATAIGILTT